MSRAELIAFIRRHRLAVVASATSSGAPQAAVVGMAVTDDLELVFDTLGGSRKAQNLRRDGRAAVVIGWDDEQTLQLEGTADEPTGDALAQLQRSYFHAFPDGPTRLSWPGITYFRIVPTWARFSDFRAASARVIELSAGELAAA